eukprot:1337817-Rhodomonas_salina.1
MSGACEETSRACVYVHVHCNACACVGRQPDRVMAIASEERRPINSKYSVTMSGACEKASLPCSTVSVRPDSAAHTEGTPDTEKRTRTHKVSANDQTTQRATSRRRRGAEKRNRYSIGEKHKQEHEKEQEHKHEGEHEPTRRAKNTSRRTHGRTFQHLEQRRDHVLHPPKESHQRRHR